MLFRDQSGMGLLGLIISCVTIGILLSPIHQLLNAIFRQQYSLLQESDRLVLRNFIARQVHCETTLIPKPAACAVEGTISLKKQNGTVFIAGPYSLVGSPPGIKIRARCVTWGSSDVVRVEYLPKNSANSSSDGVWKDLYGGIPLHCSVPH